MSIEAKGSGEGERRNYQLNSAGKPERNDDHLCSPSTFASHLKFTLKCWPVIAGAAIGLCYLTQQVASWFGITLPDQANIEIVKRYAGWNRTFAFLCLQIIVLLPALEELAFRYLLFCLPNKFFTFRFSFFTTAAISSLLFSAAHYIAQPWPDAAFIALFFFGLAQCWLYKKTGRLWCPILNHALFNLTNLILLFIIPEAT